MATGCHTCGGTLTGPVGTTREASKVTMVFETVSVCGARVPVPLVTKAPEAPPTAQSVVLNWPVILRVSSLCHAPASSMLPPVQARKSAGRGKNPFLFAMLFEKNIEIFSDPNPSVLCVFSICLPPFRAWTGVGREAGSWQGDTMRNLNGSVGNTLRSGVITDTGVFVSHQATYAMRAQDGGALPIYIEGFNFYAAEQVSTAPENRPVNVALPVILYLGLPA